jgi:DNA polymerase-3 subunit delta
LNGRDSGNVYLVFGEDGFLVEETLRTLLQKLARTMGAGAAVESVDCEGGRADEVLAEIVSPSLFAANKITVLKHIRFGRQRSLVAEIEKCISEGLVPGQVLILVSTSVDKRLKLVKTINRMGGLIEVPAFRPEDTERWIIRRFDEQGKKASPPVARLIMDLKDDLRSMASEIDKVVTYVGDAGEVTVSDIESAVGRSKSEKTYMLTKAVIAGDTGRALSLLSELLERGESAVGLLYSLSRETRGLIQIQLFCSGTSAGWHAGMHYGAFRNTVLPRFEKWVEDAGISRSDTFLRQHPYAVYMRFVEGEGLALEELVRFLDGLLAANVNLVSTSVPPDVIMETLITSLGIESSSKAGAGN